MNESRKKCVKKIRKVYLYKFFCERNTFKMEYSDETNLDIAYKIYKG